MYPVYVSKHNWNRKKQATLLTIGKLRRTALSCNIKMNNAKAMVTFIVWIVFTTLEEKNLNPIKKYLKITIWYTVMPSEDKNGLEFNQYQKSNKAPFII